MEVILTRKVSAVASLAGAALFAVLVLAFGAPAASANHEDPIAEGGDDSYGEAVCFVNGAAGTANSPVDSVDHDANGTPADPDPSDEAWDDANMMDTDGGDFNFASSTVACSGEDQGGEAIGETTGTNFVIKAGKGPGFSRLQEAEYTNLVCGTGHAEGSADLFRPDNPGPHTTDLKTRFSIDFVGGTGPMAITSFEGYVGLDNVVVPKGTPQNPPVNPQDVDTGWGEGVVQITPTTGDCATTDVQQFLVDAAFEATLSGDEDVPNDDNEVGVGSP